MLHFSGVLLFRAISALPSHSLGHRPFQACSLEAVGSDKECQCPIFLLLCTKGAIIKGGIFIVQGHRWAFINNYSPFCPKTVIHNQPLYPPHNKKPTLIYIKGVLLGHYYVVGVTEGLVVFLCYLYVIPCNYMQFGKPRYER